MKKLLAAFLSVLMCLSVMSATGISVLAETAEGYTVTFYEDSTKETVFFHKENMEAGKTFVLTSEPSKEGHTFVSWVDAETGEKVEFLNDVVVVPNKNAEYYVEWEINSYSLVYRGYGEVFAEYDVAYGTPADKMPVPEGIPERAGYEFIEWSALPETMPASKLTVAARWRDTNLEAHFYIDPDDAEPYESVPYLYGDGIYAPDKDPSKTGYTFEGWSLDGETVVGDLGYIGDEDAKIFAVWSANEYNATFDANGGSFADGSGKKIVPVKYDSQIVFDEVPAREFFVFNGWTPKVGTMNNTNGINFRANWIRAEEIYYTVRTYVMGTDGKYTSTEKMYSGKVGETVTANYSVDTGFELNKTKSVLSGVVKTDCSLVLKVYLDRGLYDFYLNVDGVKTGGTYLYGEAIPTPEDPVKEGYTFLGWVPAVPKTMPDTDYTVTATWKKNEAPAHTHTEKTVTVDPTCTKDGKEYKVCDSCGETIGDETVIPAKGHESGDWTVVLEPTYETDGKKIKKCLTCGVTLLEETIAKLANPSEPNDKEDAAVKIRNNPGSTTLKYGETLRVYAEATNIPQGGKVEWSISGEGAVITKTEGSMCEIQVVSDGTAMLTVTVVDADGNPVRNENGEKITDTQFITAKAGIIQKIIAFFKKLFGLNQLITQSVKYMF